MAEAAFREHHWPRQVKVDANLSTAHLCVHLGLLVKLHQASAPALALLVGWAAFLSVACIVYLSKTQPQKWTRCVLHPPGQREGRSPALASSRTHAAAAAARRPPLLRRWREAFLSVGHPFYILEANVLVAYFFVTSCPEPWFSVVSVVSSTLPWLLLDPLMMPISYRALRWVQPASVFIAALGNGAR